MSNEPIISRLEVNLGWKAWLKPFFIHPSMTAGAADNMSEVRELQKRQEAARKAAAQVQLNIAALEAINTKVKDKDIDALDRNHPIARIKEVSGDTENRAEHHPAMLKDIFDQFCLMIASENAEDSQWAKDHLLPAFKGVSKEYDAIIGLIELAAQEDTDAHNELSQLLRLCLQAEDRNYLIFNNITRLNPNNALTAEAQRIAEPLDPAFAAQRPARPAPEASVKPYVHPKHIFQGAFLKVFGVNGFDHTTGELVTAGSHKASFDGESRSGEFPHVPFSLVFWTLLGAPNRLHNKANLTLREVIRNIFGGWNSLYKEHHENSNDPAPRLNGSIFWWLNFRNYTFEGKRLWNVILLLTGVKLAIAAVNIAIMAFNLVRNVFKLAFAYIPEVALQYSGLYAGQWASLLALVWYAEFKGLRKLIKLPYYVVYGVLATIAATLNTAFRAVALVATAVISPEQSARSAWNYGRALNSRFGYVFAFVGAAASVALTAIMWTLLFPVALGEALVLFPALAPIVTSISQLPVVAAALKIVNGGAALVAGTLPAAFSTAATAISAALGITVSATTLAVTATVAFIAAPVGATASRLADYFSYVWTQWLSYSPLLISAEYNPSVVSQTYTSAKNSVKAAVAELTPSFLARSKAEDGVRLLGAAGKAADAADSHAEAKPYFAQEVKAPSPGIYSEPSFERNASYVKI